MKRIMIDFEKCDGCKNCTVACMQAHREEEGSIYTLDLTDPANEARHRIVQNTQGKYMPLFCRHCDSPDCVSACMSGAMTKNTQTGHVEYDPDQCAACFMCVMECPYGILKPDTLTRTKVIRCDFCKEDGEQPNCVQACPKQAIWVMEVEPAAKG